MINYLNNNKKFTDILFRIKYEKLIYSIGENFMISIICVYNDKEVLENYLLKSLTTQSVEYEVILIDNIDGKFKSAPEALNYGGDKANGDHLMFVHQDVELISNKWLEDNEKVIKRLDNCGIAGVAGISENEFRLKTNIKHSTAHIPAGDEINIPTEVQTLDECLIIIPKAVFNEFKFDEKLVGWHLYSVDYCLNIKKQGFKAYVIPAHAYHRSYYFGYPKEYYQLLKLIFEKHRANYKIIHTSCGVFNTSYPIVWYIFLNTKVGFFIRSIIDYLLLKFNLPNKYKPKR